MIKPEREYRNFKPFETRQAEEGEEKNYIVEGYATTFGEPYELFKIEDKSYYEVIDAKALEGTDLSDVIFLYNHEGMVYARQKNGTLQLSVDEHGLKVVADLGSTEESRKIYEAIESGLIDQMSFAFTISSDAYDKKTRTRTITGIEKLYDVSAVSIPANPGTDISVKRFIDGVIEEERQELLMAERAEWQKQKIKLILEVL